jgi:ATP-dependent RNA helicase HrpB
MRPELPTLPITSTLPALLEAMSSERRVILEAPPGAGKSTLAPIALLDADWARGGTLLMLEPRRVAARAVAARMAALLGEPLGATVGFRTRLDRNVGPHTRLEVITEGILTRRLQDDPALEGTACVIFDEFHERSLQADLGLALCLDAQEHLRETLRVLVMSATLDGQRLAQLLAPAKTVCATHRGHAVETRYVPAPVARSASDDLERPVCATALRALDEHEGDVLAFLPGAREIRRVTEQLLTAVPRSVDVVPLYGELGPAAQDQALRAAAPGRRKTIVATNIAETSLTIEGVRVVVDSGYERRPRFDPNTGMSRLDTVRISRASADQRRGRAGRTAPGVCYRLWSESVDATLVAHSPPEIIETDLTPLALELAAWGCNDPHSLKWLDPPPDATLAQARDLLRSLEAIDEHDRITALGRRMARLAVHPRLAHMIVRSEALGLAPLALRIAAVLTERDFVRGLLRSRDPDLRARLDALERDTAAIPTSIDAQALRQVRRSVEQLERRWQSVRARKDSASTAPAASSRAPSTHEPPIERDVATGLLLAFAYPDRIGCSRTDGSGLYLLSGGRGARFVDPTALARSEFIVAATLDAGDREARIQLAAPLERALIDRYLADATSVRDVVEWNPRSAAVVAQRERRLGALTIDTSPLADTPHEPLEREMLRGIRALGLEALPWTRDLQQWRARIALLRSLDGGAVGEWPDVSDAALTATLESWLAPWLEGVSRREHLARIDLRAALGSLLDFQQQRRLEQLAPTHLVVPSGSRISLDYTSGQPMLSVRLQEVFGLLESPKIAGGMPVTLELLSPARRPVQVTRDLASFWQRGYAEVRKELKGRYPKHYWPQDPFAATPTRRVRPK